MTVDRKRLRELALAVGGDLSSKPIQPAGAWGDFYRAANPQTILALLDALEAAEQPAYDARLASLVARAEAQADRMESFATAYPDDIFLPLTPEQRAHAGDSIITRASAEMGRHFSPFALAAAKILREAAAALADGRAEADAEHKRADALWQECENLRAAIAEQAKERAP